MSEPVFRVGLLGWGNAGRYFHAPFIDAVPGLELTAVLTSRSEVHAYYPEVRIASSAEEIVNDADVSLVVVATPHRLHVQHARMALEAGKHVIVEKPVAETALEAAELVKAAEYAGRLLIVFQNRRYDGDFLTVRQIIESGVLGDIYYYESQWSLYRPRLRGVWREKPEQLGGLLYDLGPHLIDQTLVLFGKPLSVYAQVGTHRENAQVDDFFRIQVLYGSGLLVTLMVDMMASLPGPRFHVRGNRGSYEKYGLDPQEAALRSGALPRGPSWGVEDRAMWGTLKSDDFHGLPFDGHVPTRAGDYRLFYQAVYQALKRNGPSPIETDKVITQLQIIEAAQRSARTNAVQVLE